MKRMLISFLTLLAMAGCSKDKDSGSEKIEIYLLRSFDLVTDNSTGISLSLISNPVLERVPLVADEDLLLFFQDDARFTLRKSVKARLQNKTRKDGFAVTVGGRPIYTGLFNPGYSSSLPLGTAVIDPIMAASRQELWVQFFSITNFPDMLRFDQRYHPRLIAALEASGRLR